MALSKKKKQSISAESETYDNLIDDIVLQLKANDVYRLLEERGYFLGHKFQTIAQANIKMNAAELAWNDDWVTFLDGALQLCALQRPHDGVSRPVSLLSLVISPEAYSTPDLVRARLEPHEFNCRGIILKGIRFEDRPWPAASGFALNSFHFMPHFPDHEMNVDEAVHMQLQIVADNMETVTIVQPEGYALVLQKSIQRAIRNLNTARYSQTFDLFCAANHILNPHLMLVHELNLNMLKTLPVGSFALCIISADVSVDWEKLDSVLVSCARTTVGQIQLIRRRDPTKRTSNVLRVRFEECMRLLNDGLDSKNEEKLLVTSELPSAGIKLPELVKAAIPFDVCLCLSDSQNLSETSIIMQSQKQLKINIYKDKMWGGLYLVPTRRADEVADAECKLKLCGVGSELKWRYVPSSNPSGSFVRVQFAAVNEYDASVATGRAPAYDDSAAPHEYGLDFSGINERGEPVMGISTGTLSTLVEADMDLLWPVPAHWSLEDAATVPLPYSVVYYCVAIRNNIQSGTTWLIHAATSALGQAAIAIGLSLKCTIFAAVQSHKQKCLLSSLFPELPQENILCSYASAFKDSVLTATRGCGVDLALGSMSGDIREATFCCIKRFGVLCDVSNDTTAKQDETLGLYYLTRDRTYMTIWPAKLADAPKNVRRTLNLMVEQGVALGHVRPLTRVVLPAVEVDRTLKLITAGRVPGRVILNLNSLKEHITISPNHWICETSKKAVTVWCGNASIHSGALLVDGLVRNGSRSILLQRDEDPASSLDAAYVNYKIRQWKRAGADVQLLWCSEADSRKQLEVLRVATRGQTRMLLMVECEGTTYGPKLVKLREAATEVYPELQFLVAITTRPEPVLHWEPAKDVVGELRSALVLHAPDSLKGKEWVVEPCYWNSVIDALNTGFRVGGGVMLLTASTVPQKEEKNVHEDPDESAKQGRARGLAILFPRIESDELRTAAELTVMPTIVHNGTQRCDEFDCEEIYLTIVPGFDDHPDTFAELCERLRLPAVLLHSAVDQGAIDTVYSAADRYVQVLNKTMVLKDHFYLFGHSFGVIVALEMAARLEKQGLVGTVFCVDTTPDALPVQLRALLQLSPDNDTGDQALQNAIVEHICRLLVYGQDSTEPIAVWEKELQRALCAARDWPAKVDAGVRQLRGRVPHSFQYARAHIEAAYTRVRESLRYSAEALAAQPLRSHLVLARRALQEGETNKLASDLGLSRLSSTPVTVHELRAGGVDDARLPAIINKYMRPQEMERFSKRDLRESYLLYADKFITYAFE